MVDSIIPVPTANMVIFGDSTNFMAYGSGGLRWQSRRVSWDGIRFVTIENNEIVGEAWTPIGEMWQPFAVNITSGDLRGGSYGLPE
jgi:hypothetical protein